MKTQSKYIAYANLGAVALDLGHGLLSPVKPIVNENGLPFFQYVGLLSLWNVDVRVQATILLVIAWHMGFALHGLFIGALFRILSNGCSKRLVTKGIAVISLMNGIAITAYSINFFLCGNEAEYSVNSTSRSIFVKTRTPINVSFILCFGIPFLCLLALFCVMWRHLSSFQIETLSRTCIRRQKMLFANSFIQFLVPLLFFASPTAARLIVNRLGSSQSEAVMDFSSFIRTFYGSVFTLITILLYRPYRKYFTDRFRYRKRSEQTEAKKLTESFPLAS
ncbi:unnamed protein product, partial [Mesorhabditis belari]|uniref:G protein-coupled receptor n=1 Tax=Mesorhabditis belari TaxID=2138241 RepID=A0AAF3EK87_9BILA